MTDSRLIEGVDLVTAGFDALADNWAQARGVSTEQTGKANSTALGILPADNSMGTSPGTLLTDNVTAKVWFQELETHVEDLEASLAAGLPDSGPVLAQMQAYVDQTEADAVAVGADKLAVTTLKADVQTLYDGISQIEDAIALDAAAVAVDKDSAQLAATEATNQYNKTVAASIVGGDYFPGARLYVPQGAITGVGTITTAGSGGVDGTYALGFTGGTFSVNPTGTFTVTGGVVAAITITGAGLFIGTTPTKPTLTFTTSAGLTGAAGTFSTKYLKTAGEYYYTDHATDSKIVSYFQNQGNTPVQIKAIVDWLNFTYLDTQVTAAQNWATLAQGYALALSPRVYVNISSPVAGNAYPADFNIVNGLTFTRISVVLVGTGSAEIAVIGNGVLYGPTTVDDDGLIATVDITVASGSDISFSIPTITGDVSFIHISLDGI